MFWNVNENNLDEQNVEEKCKRRKKTVRRSELPFQISAILYIFVVVVVETF